ncbi:MAG: hypothetical protein LBU85_02945 [Treponema sp.]|jgi:hypothetical protein|nr:hypothetical protein [Treponema sp.]
MPQEQKAINVVNLHLHLTDEKLNEIINVLEKHDIEIKFRENYEPQASLFDSIIIFFNEPLTKQILLNLLSAGVFEAIKIYLLPLYKNLTKFKTINSAGVQKQSSLNIRLKTSNSALNVPIPSNLSDNQFYAYLDMVHKTLINLGRNDILNFKEYNEYVIEGEEGEEKTLKTKTMVEYALEQRTKKKKS